MPTYQPQRLYPDLDMLIDKLRADLRVRRLGLHPFRDHWLVRYLYCTAAYCRCAESAVAARLSVRAIAAANSVYACDPGSSIPSNGRQKSRAVV